MTWKSLKPNPGGKKRRSLSFFFIFALIFLVLDLIGHVLEYTGLRDHSLIANMAAASISFIVFSLLLYGVFSIEKRLAHHGMSLRSKTKALQTLQGINDELIQNAPFGVLSLDASRRLTTINATMQTILGLKDFHEGMGILKLPQIIESGLDRKIGESYHSTSAHTYSNLVIMAADGRSKTRVNWTCVPIRTKEEKKEKNGKDGREARIGSGGKSGTTGKDGKDGKGKRAGKDGKSGRVERMLCFCENLQDRVELERQLFHTERLASIGVLAAGVAHEINTPLTSMAIITDKLKERASDDFSHRKLQTLKDQIEAIARITQSLLEFSRRSESIETLVDINWVLKHSLELIRDLRNMDKFEVKMDLSAGIPELVGDPDRLQQAFMNLMANALDAMEKGGKLWICTRLKSNNTLIIEVRDSGTGIPESSLPLLFDPFFTTKKTGQGTGLGLSISYAIIESHAGSIEVQSELGIGTTFRVTLPVEGI